MNGAQRAAFVEMVRIADQMSNVCFNLKQRDLPKSEEWKGYKQTFAVLQYDYDAARNRYFELEAEAREAKSSARKSRGDVRQKAGDQVTQEAANQKLCMD